MAPTALVSNPANKTLTKQDVVKKDKKPADPKPQSETPLQAICYGGTLPGIPTPPTFASHRLWALSHTTALFRHWARCGYTLGMSGHISVRDPEFPSLFWTNPLAVHFGLLRVSDLLLLADTPDAASPLHGRILAGNRLGRPANKAGWAIHAAVHRARADVNAVCHAHTPYGKVWAATGRRLAMVDQDVCGFDGDALAYYEEYGGVVLGKKGGEGEAIARALGARGKGAVLANHGLLAVGGTVDEAGFLFGLLERSCRVQVELGRVVGAEGGTRVVGREEARFNFEMASTPETLYWEFQPDYDYEVAMSHDRFVDVGEEDLEVRL
ncbi:hypothetical protein MMC34_006708 [Xylographa carneopallida]|nr:hypothetical protein [Xylographa carneopallida]